MRFSATNEERIKKFIERNPFLDLSGFAPNFFLEYLRDGYSYVNENNISSIVCTEEITLNGGCYYQPTVGRPLDNGSSKNLISVEPNDVRWNYANPAELQYDVTLEETALSSAWRNYLIGLGYNPPNYVVLFKVVNPITSPIKVKYLSYFPEHGERYLILPSPYPNTYSESDITSSPTLIDVTVELDDECCFNQTQFDLWMKVKSKMDKRDAEFFGLSINNPPQIKRHKVDYIEHEYQNQKTDDYFQRYDTEISRALMDFRKAFGGNNFIYA